MELKFVDLDLFDALAERRVRVAEERFIVKSEMLGKIAIAPGVSLHEDLTVLGTDWIPARGDGIATLQQMTHTPQTFLPKARNIAQREGRWFTACATQRAIEEPVVLAGGNINYYHWWIDNVPRLLMARKYGQLEGRKVLVNHDLTSFAAGTLRRLGIGEERLVRVSADEALLCGDVCVPAMLASATAVHPAVPPLVRDALGVRGHAGGKRRIYLSRQDAGSRRLVNEEAFTEVLARWGFERMLPSRMSVDEQIECCSEAEAIVAVHGAALANMLFAPAGAAVIEIFTPAYPASFYVLLAHACGVRHVFSPAPLVEAQAGVSPLYHPLWEADLEALERTLRETLG
ncbi:MAG TPA: glycosyltransferase 61 family protein [Ramlibacter sp.]|uniref:glycosyltransferase family 61 protein n=1 Tax=Ramlibacter sp. TaxID=1917967 RepID=UPI002C2C732D|nr:glycosyltransferase 61 family protein [Ramlibacter sp.]HVZ47091.1 glycosyltransferase 61 family protein [Ramlibacter sp.]